MSYKLHTNGVITGSLNCFCLACDVFLKSPQDATDHVKTDGHQMKANAVQFCDKFLNEYIKKFTWGYYCKFCNFLMPTASKVNLHITEDEHKHNKGLLLLKPVGLDVVAFNNVLIEERAWHGLIEGVCSLCNTEYEDENDHKNEAGHSLNLILTPIQFGANNDIFRPLDDTSVQCLTCNKLLAPSKMTKHLEDTEHQELYAKRHIETNEVCHGTAVQENCHGKVTNITTVIESNDETNKSKVDNDVIEKTKSEDKQNKEKSPTKDKSKILESISAYQTKGININLETETAFCKKCSEVVTFDVMEIKNHIENHSSATAAAVNSDLLYPSNRKQNLNRVDINDKTTHLSNNKIIDGVVNASLKDFQNDSTNKENYDSNLSSSVDGVEKGIQDEEARNFAKANKLTCNGNNNQSFCLICKVHVPFSIISMKEHVEGTNHKRILLKNSTTQPAAPKKLSKQKTDEFVKSSYVIVNPFYIACLINEKYCILRSSLYLVSENTPRIRCFVCDVNLPPHTDVADHATTRLHMDRWKQVTVVTSEANEFIREVRPGLFHCGYCHLLVSGWTDMKQHLACFDHQENRTNWERRMSQHLPDVQQFRMQELLTHMAMGRLFNRFNC